MVEKIIVFPINDPHGVVMPRVEEMLPELKRLFQRAIISVTPECARRQPQRVERLEKDPFFTVMERPSPLAENLPTGVEFRALYGFAAESCMPGSALHLAYPDRLAFALLNGWAENFDADMRAVRVEDTPLIFERSQAAWATHPRNYYELETMMTRTGVWILGQRLDFGWCHLVVTPEQLRVALQDATHPGISMVGGMVLGLLGRWTIKTKAVDWLAWEDPFLLGREADELRRERESSPEEARKRLAYVIPILEMLYRYALQHE